jgi:uncharacterized protein YndB with AHSA1/START domain
MTVTITPAPVRKSVTVDAPIDKAFDVFTKGFGRWWPKSYTIGKSPLQSAVIEPATGGRWYEIGEDGAECDWGDVLAWEPPTRLLLAWRIGPDWQYRKELLTEVEVRFVAVGERTTRVELEHRLLENMGEGAERIHQTFDGEHGWSGILAGYAAEAERTA